MASATTKSRPRSYSEKCDCVSQAEPFDRPIIRIPANAATLRGFREWALSRSRPERLRLSYIGGEICIDLDPAPMLLQLPARAIATLAGFRKWVTSDAVPDRGRFSYLGQELWIDMSPEEIETHNKVKTTTTSTIYGLNEQLDLGELYSDRTLVTNEKAGLSTEPDAGFVTWRSFRAGRARLVPREDEHGQFMEVKGRPDWVLEILSRWSRQKDTKELRDRYHRARIPEYWLIDAQGDEIVFQILVWRKAGYVAVVSQDGWPKSRIFGCYFRLTRTRNRLGRWHYRLEVKRA
jgi:Uma2 family endonuclease